MSFTKINYIDNETIITAENLNAIQDEILNVAQSIYPIGSIYMSISDVSPASFIGGTWERITDKFLLGSGSRSIEATGGQESVSYTPAGKNAGTALSTSQIPAHAHVQKLVASTLNNNAGSTSATGYQTNIGWWTTMQVHNATVETSSVGSGSSHTHTFTGTASTISTMPPYLVVNIWKRVS